MFAVALSSFGFSRLAKRLSLTQDPIPTRGPPITRSTQNPKSPAPPAPAATKSTTPSKTTAPPLSKTTAPPPPPCDDSDESESSSSSEDSDDAPLATLVAPRRPGSSLSLASNSAGSNPNLASRSAVASPPSVSGSSSSNGKPKPLIDIHALAASKPTLAGHKRTDDGFTGGGMLASTSPLQIQTNQTQTPSPVLTSRSPPPPSSGRGGFVQFPSPPGSPVSESPPPVFSSAVTVAPKRSPMRQETGGSVVSLGAGGKRDVLSDRLKAVATVAGGSTSDKESSSAKARSPPTSFSSAAARKAFHRRSSSDIVSAAGRSRSWLDDVPAADADDGSLGRDIANMLGGGGIALVLGGGDVPFARTSVAETTLPPSKDETQVEDQRPQEGTIVPIVIKQPLPSRPPNRSSTYSDLGTGTRQRSSTLIPPSTTTSSVTNDARSTASASTNTSTSASTSNSVKPRQRSSTMVSLATTTTTPIAQPTPSSARQQPAPLVRPPPIAQPSPSPSPPSLLGRVRPPQRPFAVPRKQSNSPASSMGDSSSGPAPLTPRDGSETGSGSGSGRYAQSALKSANEKEEVWSGGVSGLLPPHRRTPAQRRSVSFDFDEGVVDDGKLKAKAKAKPRETPAEEEERRKERRRSEAKAAIDLGNIVNGRAPVPDDDDDEDDDLPINQTRVVNPMMNMPMSNMGMPMGMNIGMNMSMFGSPSQTPGWPAPAWQQAQQQAALSPGQFMMPPPADPNLMVAHQQAMLYAKQAYQMAVAQQAMAAAGDEWERGSTMTGFAGGGGSVYGAGGMAPSQSQASLSPFGMGLAMLNAQQQSPGGFGPGMMFPPGARSMYGGARSEYGGVGGGGAGGNWNSSRSVYGEAFGPSTERYASPRSTSSGNLAAAQGQSKGQRAESGYFAGAVPSSSSGQSQSLRPPPANPRQRTASQPASPSKPGTGAGAGGRRPPPPPSSWKATAS
ncbi:hypothetical protein C8F01DRAFT_1181362 [Mycena amicta]|nr:hypothetical protein C8F01DRAFT_1181362 [Mycena amicta]